MNDNPIIRLAVAATSKQQCHAPSNSDMLVCVWRSGVSVLDVAFRATLAPETARHYDTSLIRNSKTQMRPWRFDKQIINREKACLHLPKVTTFRSYTAPSGRSSARVVNFLGDVPRTCRHLSDSSSRTVDKTTNLWSLSSSDTDSSSVDTSSQWLSPQPERYRGRATTNPAYRVEPRLSSLNMDRSEQGHSKSKYVSVCMSS